MEEIERKSKKRNSKNKEELIKYKECNFKKSIKNRFKNFIKRCKKIGIINPYIKHVHPYNKNKIFHI